MTCTEADLERYDREGEEFREEMMPLVLEGHCSLRDIFGFKLDQTKTRAYLDSDEVSARAFTLTPNPLSRLIRQ
jgi:hypothetical protein